MFYSVNETFLLRLSIKQKRAVASVQKNNAVAAAKAEATALLFESYDQRAALIFSIMAAYSSSVR